MNVDCRAIRPLLSAYMDNDLTPDELRAVQAHIAACAECAATLAEYRQLRSLVRALPQPTPPLALRQAVFAKATPAYRRRSFLLDLGQRGLAYGALAVAVLAIVFTASLLLRSGVGGVLGGPDKTAPRIVDWRPTPSTDFGLNQPVRIVFSEEMDHDSVIAALSISTIPPLGDAEYARLKLNSRWEGNTLIIGGAENYQPNLDYIIKFTPNVARDHAGNYLQGPLVDYSFRTVDTVAILPTPTPSQVPSPTPTPKPTLPIATDVSPSPTPAVAPVVSPTATPGTTPITNLPTATTAASLPPQPSNPPAAIPTPQPSTPPTATPAPPAAPTATPEPPTATPIPPTPTVRATPALTPSPSLSPSPSVELTVTPTRQPTITPTPAITATPAPPTATPTPKLPFDVVNGFGQIYTRNPAVRERIGLPLGNESRAAGAYLAFEGGVMFWRGDTRTIYVLFNGEPGIWYAFADSWVEGMDDGGGAGPAAGQFKPKRGFGKVWSEQPDVQKRLGYALTADEVATQFGLQSFERGLMLWTNADGKPYIYVLYQNNLYERYPDVAP